MRRLLILVAVLLFAAAALGQQQHDANAVAHGSEKVAHEAAHPGEEHGGAHEEPKFLGLPAWIFKLINMLLFFGVLFWLVGGPVRKALGERAAAIRAAADEARTRRAKADAIAGEIQERLTQMENEIRAIQERAERDGERQKRELMAAAEAEAAKILANARAEVDNRVKHARHELTEYAGQLASERAEQILREKITQQDQEKLFRESLQQVEEVGS
jgi:F-type H+-transporting ATPase subunit b